MAENSVSKTPVAPTPRRTYGVLIASVIALLVLTSIWLQAKHPTKARAGKPVVTASQADTRHSQLADTVLRKVAQPLPTETRPATPELSQAKASFARASLANANQLQEKRQAQQLAAAQRRLTAPSQAYSLSSSVPGSAALAAKAAETGNVFADTVAKQVVNTLQAKQQLGTDYKLFQGKIIPAVLDSAVNSDLPGMVRATITEDVYGETGRQLLLPRGSRLIGQYNSAVKTGQVRVYILWTRAITPQQVDVQLASPGVDALGRAGLAGEVDNHFWQIFGSSLLLSVMAAGVADSEMDANDTLYGNPYQYHVVQGLTENSSATLERQSAINPTIIIDQGEPVRVMAAHDLDFTQLAVNNVVHEPWASY